MSHIAEQQDLSYTTLSFVTFQATIEVIIICFAGWYVAKTGLLNKNAQKTVSLLNVDLFTPCLIFSKLAPSLSFQKLIEISVIPVFYAVSTGISYMCGRVTSKYLQLNEDESNFVMANSVFGNSNSLPVSLTLALAYSLPNLEWDDLEDDTRDKIASRGILYLLIFQQIGQVLRWSWGYNTLLRGSLQKLNSTNSITGMVSQSTENQQFGELRLYDDETIVSKTKSLVLWMWTKFTGFMNPPLYAMLVSVIVASIPPVQNEFFVKNGFAANTLVLAVKQLGSVSIPLILIVLGSNLYPSDDIPPASRNYKKMVFGSLVSRMVLPAIFMLPLIAFTVKFFSISILDDPIFLLVAFILTISPPAIQLSQICQLNEFYEKEMAGVLFWGYVILTLPTTICVVVSALEVLKWAGY